MRPFPLFVARCNYNPPTLETDGQTDVTLLSGSLYAIYGLGRFNFKYLLLLRTVKFYERLYLKSGLLHDVFWSFMIFKCDDCMRTVFIPLHKAVRNLLNRVLRLCV